MIQEAEPEDIDDLFELWQELMRFHQGHHTVFKYKPTAEQILKVELLSRLKDKDTKFLGFVSGNEWQGMIVVFMRKASPGFKLSRKGYIGETIVKKKYRGTGVGKELFEAAKKWLQDKGADHVELQVSVKNAAGIKFWEALGFTPSTYHMVLELPEEK
ncbi:GNAT family N-acetyltransferase [Pontibacter harenae]|uniref:GNAT family N-acetyltransferase n=1 Tax=Pontibacter harenae TaxID=2894083 RepID=UPI001E54F84F|nr:GNAT family N-acetyltransferase [Pontibacter harenae]MCC9165734.1 GNAT family N-acetyltransferase [Pontibacter harenae]